MYSRQHKKVVFIDFGISESLTEHIGQKSKTFYKGTYGYSSK